MTVLFYPWSEQVERRFGSRLKIALVMTRYHGKWLFIKNKYRQTWELPGGHREFRENIGITACRELYEETGATEFSVYPVAVYGVPVDNERSRGPMTNFGGLFYARVKTLGDLPPYETMSMKLWDTLPREPYSFPPVLEAVYQYVVERESEIISLERGGEDD